MTLSRTSFATTLAADSLILGFAFRQTILERIELWQHTQGGLVATALTTRPLRLNPMAHEIVGTVDPGDYEVVVYYRGLPPIWVYTQSKGEKAETILDSDSSMERARLIDKHFQAPQLRETACAWQKFDEATDRTNDPATVDMAVRFRSFLLNRATERAARNGATPGINVDPALLTLSEALEPRFAGALDSHLSQDLAELRRLFAAFTCSQIGFNNLEPEEAQYKFLGVPDGAMHLCFTEAALWFCESMPSKSHYWLPRARLFAGSMPAFASLYWQPGAGHRTRHCYSHGPLPQPADPTPVVEEMERLANYELAALSEYFGNKVSETLADEAQDIQVDGSSKATRALELLMLDRTSPTHGNPDEATFEAGNGPPFDAIAQSIQPTAARLRIDFHADPQQQQTILETAIDERLRDMTFRDADEQPLRIDRCNGRPSVWNPRTKRCDPEKSEPSFRWRLEKEEPWPCRGGAAPNSNIEFTLGAPRIHRPEPPTPLDQSMTAST